MSQQMLCPSCRYCLKSLPYSGVCPECGCEYEAREPSVAEAVRCFTDNVPKHRRLWLTPEEECSRFPSGALLKIIAAYAILSVLFVLAEALATVIAYHLPGGARTRVIGNLAFVSFVPRYGSDIRIDTQGAAFVVFSAFLGQMLLGTIIWARYAWAARRAHLCRRVLRRLGVFAMAGVPTLLALPMAAIAAWQTLNTYFPGGGGIELWRLLRPDYWLRADWVQMLSIALIVVPGSIMGLSLYRMHRRAIAQVRDTLNGVVARPHAPTPAAHAGNAEDRMDAPSR